MSDTKNILAKIATVIDVNGLDQQYIDYAINICKHSYEYIKNNYHIITEKTMQNNFLLLSSAYGDIKILKFLIETCKMDVKYTNQHGNNCLTLACRENNFDIIKYLIETCKMDVEHTNQNGNNCLTSACWKNTNLDIIKYLIETCKMDVKHIGQYGVNCLTYACQENTNLDIIKYLIETCKMDVNEISQNGYNCLTLACCKNTNLDIIKYLIETCKMDVKYTIQNGGNCLTYACQENTNLDIIKYLIETCKMDVNEISQNGYNCLTYACRNNTNLDIIKYLIEIYEHNLKLISFDKIPFDKYEKIILTLDIQSKISDIFLAGIVHYGIDSRMNETMRKINPLLLTPDVRDRVEIKNPYHSDYKTVTTYVDKLKQPINVPDFTTPIKTEKKAIDFTFANVGLLFIHNKIKYYGHKETVYDAFEIFKNITNLFDTSESIILGGSLPKHIINAIIGACYSGSFNINIVDKEYFIEFLKFVDKYPTSYVSMNVIENQIIRYMIKNNIKITEYIKGLCDRYKLKYLYLHVHNQFLLGNTTNI